MKRGTCVRSTQLAILTVALSISSLLAQDNGDKTADQPQYRVDAYASLHEVRVRDFEGNVVTGLQATDFEVTENGSARPITFFLERSQFPVTLAILVDTGANMSETAIGTAKNLFLDLVHRLEPEDQILLASYRDEVHYLTPLTSDRLAILDGLTNLSASGRKSGWGRLATLFASDAWTGSAIDEVLLHLKKLSAEEKILLVFSAGFGNIGLGTLDHLRLAGAPMIAVSVDNRMGDFFNFGGDQAARRRIVRGSGGVSFEATEILQRVGQLRDLIKHHYLLAFQPEEPEKLDSAKISISISGRPDCSVHFVRRTRSTSAFY